MATQRTTQKKSASKKPTAVKKTTTQKKTSSASSRTRRPKKIAAHTTGMMVAPILPVTSADAMTMPEEMMVTPIVPLNESFTKHPEHTILLIGEYYLIAVLFSIIGIACLYAILALL